MLITITQKFKSSPMILKQYNDLARIVMQQSSYPQFHVPMNQRNFDNPRTLEFTNLLMCS